MFEVPFDHPLTMSQDELAASARLCWSTNIGRNWVHSRVMLAVMLAAGHSLDMNPCLRQGQTLARAIDLRLCKIVEVVACCRIDRT